VAPKDADPKQAPSRETKLEAAKAKAAELKEKKEKKGQELAEKKAAAVSAAAEKVAAALDLKAAAEQAAADKDAAKKKAGDEKLASFGIAGGQQLGSSAGDGGWATGAVSGRTDAAEKITKAPDSAQNGLLGLFGLEVTDDEQPAGAEDEPGPTFGAMLASGVSSGVERLGRSLSFTEREAAATVDAAAPDQTSSSVVGSAVGSMANMMGSMAPTPNFTSLFGEPAAIEAAPATAKPGEVAKKEDGWGFGW